MMTDSLFDDAGHPTPAARAVSAAVVTHDALTAVEANTDDGWAATALDFIERYLRGHATMFVDDLWEAGLPRPTEARALGPVMRRAVANGWMAKTKEARPSVASHLSLKPVWMSLIVSETITR